MECLETTKCSKCGKSADIFCGDCCEWHCISCYSQEVELRLELDF